jgi:hypothetical protein
MMSSGVVVGVGFQLSGSPLANAFTVSAFLFVMDRLWGCRLINYVHFLFHAGGDTQLNELIWYSWLGGVIIGTMIGANSVLEEHCKAGPRNVVITGRYGSLRIFFSSKWCTKQFAIDSVF